MPELIIAAPSDASRERHPGTKSRCVIDRRLLVAHGIFGLSPAQHRLARLLADGKDLTQAAAELAISINTVRTQLQRRFDKVGVRNQAALLRVLLSVGPPVA